MQVALPEVAPQLLVPHFLHSGRNSNSNVMLARQPLPLTMLCYDHLSLVSLPEAIVLFYSLPGVPQLKS